MPVTIEMFLSGVVLISISIGVVAGITISRNWRRISFFIGRAVSLLRGRPPYEDWPEPIIGLDSRGWIRFLNHAAQELFDYDEAELRGEPIGSIIRGAAIRIHDWAFPEEFLFNTVIEAEGVRRNGRTIPVNCTALGKSFILVHDDSNRVRLNETQEREECLMAAFDMDPAPLLIVDKHRRVVFANRTSYAVFGPALRDRAELADLFPGAEVHGAGGTRLRHLRSGYSFSAARYQNGPEHDKLILFGHREEPRRRLEDLLTKTTAYSELLLLETPSHDSIREDLALLHAASKEAIAVVRNLVS